MAIPRQKERWALIQGLAVDMKLSARKLDKMIEEATVDCYDEMEQVSGFFTMIEDHLAIPFATQVLGVEVSVVGIEWMITEASKQCANATANGNSSDSLTWNCPSHRRPAPSGLLPIGAGSATGRPRGAVLGKPDAYVLPDLTQ